jgi:hypothetical protein
LQVLPGGLQFDIVSAAKTGARVLAAGGQASKVIFLASNTPVKCVRRSARASSLQRSKAKKN